MKSRQAAAIGAALLIGVSHLNTGHYGPNTTDLLSPENDVKDYEMIAKLKGFEVQTLVNEDANRQKLFSSLYKAAKSLKAGDTFLLTFSGYGGVIPNFGSSESLQVSTSWCLNDGQVLISELLQVISTFYQGVNVLVIADSSSNLSGANSQNRHDLIGVGHHPRALPIEIAETVYLASKDFYDDLYLSTPKPTSDIGANVIWLSACQVNQVALETEYNGYLTAAIKHIWNGGLFEGSCSDFFREVTFELPNYQSPLVQTFGDAISVMMLRSPFSI